MGKAPVRVGSIYINSPIRKGKVPSFTNRLDVQAQDESRERCLEFRPQLDTHDS